MRKGVQLPIMAGGDFDLTGFFILRLFRSGKVCYND